MNNHRETAEEKSSKRGEELKSRQMPGRTPMKQHIKEILAAAGVLIATGAVGTAQADTTLYTSATRGGKLSCIAVNVSKKALTITMSIIDGITNKTEPTVLAGPTQVVTAPGLGSLVRPWRFCRS